MAQLPSVREIAGNDGSSFFQQWSFQVSWNGESTFQYPDHGAQLERFRWLLEKSAHDDPLNSSKAAQIRKELDYYRNVLLNSVPDLKIRPDTSYLDVYDCGDGSTFNSISWELLESCRSVTVRRRVKSAPSTIGRDIPISDTFNILIVAARRFEDNEDYRQAALPILSLMQHLPDGAPLVTVDLVRPGEFESLKEHLEDARIRRNGFSYHLVHLDLHGKLDGGQAFLAFADKDVAAAKVSQVLVNNGVRYAVINACESARSDQGLRGNLAKTFVKEGMVAVLAMSYKLSVSAVSLFTRQFYGAFLQQNFPFARAAHITRQAMRNQPQRTGRFGMLVDLEDWIVPVVYCSTDDDDGVRVGKTVSRVHRRLPAFFRRTDESLVLKPTDLHGRDADILRLEERLLNNSRKGIGRLIFLDGRNGVGKTSLLRHLQWWWASTGMITSSVYIDVNDYRDKSLQDLCNHFVQQLTSHHHSKCNTEDPITWLQTRLGEISQKQDSRSEWRHPKPLLILDHFFSTGWPLGKRHTMMKGTTSETWRIFFKMLSDSSVFTIVASHTWPWYLDDHASSAFPGSTIHFLAPVAINRMNLALRTGKEQFVTRLIKGQDDIESLDLILNWCGPDLGLLNIVLPLVGKLGAAETAAMLTRGEDLLALPEFPSRLLKRLPTWKASIALWKNAPKSLRKFLVAFAPFHCYLPRCYEAYCEAFVVNRQALTHPVRSYLAQFNPEAARVWDTRLLGIKLLVLVEHLGLLPILKDMGLIKAELMMGPTKMRSGLAINPDQSAEGTMLHSIHPVFSLFLRHEARKAGYLPSKQGTLSRKAICLQKTFVDYHENRAREVLENSGIIQLFFDQSEMKECHLSFKAAMDIHLRSPIERFEKQVAIPGFLVWKWQHNDVSGYRYVVDYTEKVLYRCEKELMRMNDFIRSHDIAISAASLTLWLATHHLVNGGQLENVRKYVGKTDGFLLTRYFRTMPQFMVILHWPERSAMLGHLSILNRILDSSESNQGRELAIFAELGTQLYQGPADTIQSLSSNWNLVQGAMRLVGQQQQLYGKARSLEFWDSQSFRCALEVQRKEMDDFLTILAPAWPELLASCDSALLCKVRMLGFDERDDETGIPDEYWDECTQEFLKGRPPFPNYASGFMAAVRNRTPISHAREEFWTNWQNWTRSHARAWALVFHEQSLKVDTEEAKFNLEAYQFAVLAHLGDWELVLEHQQCLLVTERAQSFQQLTKPQLSRRITWHIRTALCALQLSLWDLCYDNLHTILDPAYDDGNIDDQQLFQALVFFVLLQTMAPPGNPRSMSTIWILHQAMVIGYRTRGIYAQNGALLSLLLHSTEAGCFVGSKDGPACLTELKPAVHAHIEFMLSNLHASPWNTDCKNLRSHLGAIERSQHTRTSFPNSEAFCRCLGHQLRAKSEKDCRAVIAEAENHLLQHSVGCGCHFDSESREVAIVTPAKYEFPFAVPFFDLRSLSLDLPSDPPTMSILGLVVVWFAKHFVDASLLGYSEDMEDDHLQYLGQWHEAARDYNYLRILDRADVLWRLAATTPPEVTCRGWRMLVEQLGTERIYSHIDRRFVHGELRLSRLNKIYALARTPMRGYMARWDRYGAFVHDHFAWLASATVYMAIILTAMQVRLATEFLGHNHAFQSASYSFTVFSILGPLIIASIIMLQFYGIFIWNWARVVHRKRTRYSELHLPELSLLCALDSMQIDLHL